MAPPRPAACGEPGLDPSNDYVAFLRRTGLRPTRQRIALSSILFSKGNRHLTAEMLHAEAVAARVPVSLATVYNNLHRFTQAGLIQQIAVDGSKAFFDTNPSDHHHFFLAGEHALLDIPATDVMVGELPVPPDGYEIGARRRCGPPAPHEGFGQVAVICNCYLRGRRSHHFRQSSARRGATVGFPTKSRKTIFRYELYEVSCGASGWHGCCDNVVKSTLHPGGPPS